MTSFSTATLEKKLADLSNTQHSVQTLSLWLIHHRKHAKAIVQAWYKELAKGKQCMADCLNLVREQSIALDCNQITFGATHAYISHIREYPPREGLFQA